MAVVRWVFEDPVTLDTYEFDLNPREGAQPTYNKLMSYETTAAASGQTIAYEGRRQAQKLEWEGTILEEEGHLAFVEWWEKAYPVRVVDDLNQEFTIYITDYSPKRKRSIHYPHRRDYTMSALVIGS